MIRCFELGRALRGLHYYYSQEKVYHPPPPGKGKNANVAPTPVDGVVAAEPPAPVGQPDGEAAMARLVT